MSTTRFQRARGESADHWPGFVDALASLLLVVIFLLSLFAVAQFALGRALEGRDAALARVRSQLAELADTLRLAETENASLETEISRLSSTLASAEAERDRLTDAVGLAGDRILLLESSLENTQELSDAAASEVTLLNLQVAALNAQLAALNDALEAAEALDAEQDAQIENLSERLNAALARRVQELERYRSQFFEALVEALGDRADVRIVGDRFVFETDVLFASASAELTDAGALQLAVIADAITDIAGRIPEDIDWILRVDGHTDVRPINTVEYASNWYLSADRAITVVDFFEDFGVESRRLVAAGFGEYHPIDPARTQSAYARNRRIEIKLDAR